ncbi:MAG TPA: cell division protein ZapA [Sedimenticola sp.]|nr:cell division protein ZapA [Sedimenticola sp.]
MTDSIPVNIHILDKEYRIACRKDEQEALLASARYLDQKMREIRAGGKVIGTDRIAVMVALNLAHELLEHRSHTDGSVEMISQRLKSMQEKIDAVLEQN